MSFMDRLRDIADDADGEEVELRWFARHLDEMRPDSGEHDAHIKRAADAMEEAARAVSRARDYLLDVLHPK